MLALDSQKLNTEAIDFSCYLARMLRTSLTGVFVKKITAGKPQLVSADNYAAQSNKAHPEKITDDMSEFDAKAISFCEACISRDTIHTVHQNKEITTAELIIESRFADVLVLDPDISLSDMPESTPTSVVKYLMHKSECPVIVAPRDFERTNEAIFTFDGSASSIYAIKQFSYLFPEFKNGRVSVIQVNRSNTAAEKKFTEWLNEHYTHVTYTVVEGDLLNRLLGYILLRSNAFVVMGTYDRNFITNLAGPGITDHIIGTIVNPVFIAHR